MNSKDLIQKLQLQQHPEGGYYRETYRAEQTVDLAKDRNRNVSTAIYYLLENNDRSAFHRIQSDELWFFHQGQALEIVFIANGQQQRIILGNNVENGEVPQAWIAANCWFGSRVKEGIGYSLVSCVVAPGFEFSEFELARREELTNEYPHLRDVIEEFT